LRECFETGSRFLILLEPDQRDGGAMIGGMRPAALVPCQRQFLAGARVIPGEL
jgi:hypothetical protein